MKVVTIMLIIYLLCIMSIFIAANMEDRKKSSRIFTIACIILILDLTSLIVVGLYSNYLP